MWLSDFGAGFFSDGGWIYSQFAGRPTKGADLFLSIFQVCHCLQRFLSNKYIRPLYVGAGRGYKPNKKDARNPTLNEDLNWFEVKFDKDNVLRPFTAFPSERK